MTETVHVLTHSIMITLFVFVMMVIVDYINVLTKGKMALIICGGRFRQYTLSSFLGATPGCLGAFMNVSFYVRGLISFGAIVGGMIATSGDEAYVMLALFPKTAIILFITLFLLGIVFAWITDKLVPLFKIKPCEECKLAQPHLTDEECQVFDAMVWKKFPRMLLARIIMLILVITSIIFVLLDIIGHKTWDWQIITLVILLFIAAVIVGTTPDHYLKKHIWEHIFKKHIWRVFLWTFFALLIIQIGLEHWNLNEFVQTNILGILFISAIIGIIPESGPHLIFVTMFAKGLIPFSVLLTSSIVQDGHGILPLLSYSVKDGILIKLFKIVFGICIGLLVFSLRI
jgi:hypothetical protein